MVNVVQVADSESFIDFPAQGSLKRAFRIVAHVKKFISIGKSEASHPNFSIASEITEAMNNLLVQEQKQIFLDEIKTLQTIPQVKKEKNFE